MKDSRLYEILQEFSEEINFIINDTDFDGRDFDKKYTVGDVIIRVKMFYGNKLSDDGKPFVTDVQHRVWDFEHAQRWTEVTDAISWDDQMDKSVPPCFQGPIVYNKEDYNLSTAEIKELYISGKTNKGKCIQENLGDYNRNRPVNDKEIEDTIRSIFK